MSMVTRLARAIMTFMAAAEAMASPWLTLAIRLWTAQAFLAPAIHTMMSGGGGGLREPLTTGWWSGALHEVTTSSFGLGVQTLCPLLLALGLAARPAAAAMLLEVLLFPDPAIDALPFWTVLLAGIVISGPGPLSVDWLLRGGGESIALPGAAAIRHAYDELRRWGEPVYRLGLRLWLAAAPVGAALAALSMTSVMSPSVAGWLPEVSSVMRGLPASMALGLALLLGLGLATRASALVLLALVPLSHLVAGDARLSWALLLASVILHGPGPYAVDRWIAAGIGRVMAPAARPGLPHVVIVGGGFGGVAAARKLRGTDCRVTLVDQRNHHLFQPLLYQVATASLSPADIATPVRGMFRTQTNVRVLLAQVTGVDPSAKTVRLNRGSIAYDYLVLATGARHSYFGRPDWEAFAPGLKSIEDGTAIRRQLLLAFEEAEAAQSEAERQAWLTFVIVGGGPTGVELAGAVAELARHGLDKDFREIDPASARVVLAQSGPRLLPAFPEPLSREAERTLRDLGVDVRLDSRVEAVTSEFVTISGEAVPARTVLWAAGVMASPAAAWLGVKPDKAGRVPVGADLTAPGLSDVFVVGDTAASDGWAGRAVPGLAPAAKQGGVYAARVMRARIAGRPAPGPFRYRHLGSLATIGRKSAVADFGGVQLHGALAWWLWGAAHIAFLIGGRNRATVLVQWVWAYLTFRRGTRLITEVRAAAAPSTEGDRPVARARQTEERADGLASSPAR